MATKTQTTQLLDKFSKLFNKPGGGDFEPAPTPSGASSKQAAALRPLKTKQREASVRAKELNHLRGIIRDGRASEGLDIPDSSPAALQSRNSRAGALERDSLLNKIDGAEAHLAQWWGTGSAPLSAQNPSRRAELAPGDDDLELDFTAMLAAPQADALSGSESAPVPLREDSADTVPQSAEVVTRPAPLDEADHTPLERCLRDAAMHYAEGNFEAAEHLLAELLDDPATDGQAGEALICALFDIYRCSADQARFDARALDYAQRFGRSPGEWYAIEEVTAASTSQALGERALHAQREKQTFWRCPAVLDAIAWADCLAHHPADSQVFSINWLPLQQIDAALAPALARQFTEWSESAVELHWVGVDTLMQALRMRRLGGDAATNEAWWLMELDLLCMAQQPQAFEELALEYCVAKELSPPSWKQMACTLVQADEIPPAADFAATIPVDPTEVETQAPGTYAVFELRGNLTGKQPPQLMAMAAAARTEKEIEITCRHLGRIDFEASYALREWLQECRKGGCEVMFTRLPHLVWVFFHTLGIQELAGMATGPH